MPLTAIVGLIVFVVIIVVGGAGYLIDSAEEKVERHAAQDEHNRV